MKVIKALHQKIAALKRKKLCQDEPSHDLSRSNPTLEIWDWKGNPIAYLKLDQSICSFDVTDDNSTVYATSFEDMDKIFIYNTDRIMP